MEIYDKGEKWFIDYYVTVRRKRESAVSNACSI